jgi:hypothetical protein
MKNIERSADYLKNRIVNYTPEKPNEYFNLDDFKIYKKDTENIDYSYKVSKSTIDLLKSKYQYIFGNEECLSNLLDGKITEYHISTYKKFLRHVFINEIHINGGSQWDFNKRTADWYQNIIDEFKEKINRLDSVLKEFDDLVGKQIMRKCDERITIDRYLYNILE